MCTHSLSWRRGPAILTAHRPRELRVCDEVVVAGPRMAQAHALVLPWARGLWPLLDPVEETE